MNPVDYLNDFLDMGEMHSCLMEECEVDSETADKAIVEWATKIANRYMSTE